MPRSLKLAQKAPSSVLIHARLLGVRLRLARKRRRLTLRELAAKAGIAYDTARAAESGNIQTSIGAYLALAWAMGLENAFDKLLKPEDDREGATLEIAHLPERVRHSKQDVDDDF
jgi:transcriptional regulator with XRE-family HTH domain